MNIKANIPVRIENTYHFRLTGPDGEVKQEAVCHNLLTNNIQTARAMMTLALGSGTREPASSDTALAHELFRIGVSEITSRLINQDKVVYGLKFVFPPTASYVGTITEAGLFSGSTMCTHCLIRDAESHPISIEKTSYDNLEVNVTVEVTASLGEIFEEKLAGYVPSLNCTTFTNYVAGLLINVMIAYRLCTGGNGAPTTETFPSRNTNYGYILHNLPRNWVGDRGSCPKGFINSSGHYVFRADYRVEASEYNTHYYRFISPVIQLYWPYGTHNDVLSFYVDMVKSGLFTRQPCRDLRAGTGDGSTKDFWIPMNYFKERTEKIYINGVEQVRGVDYTVDNFANRDRMPELMWITEADWENIKITGEPGQNTRVGSSQIQLRPDDNFSVISLDYAARCTHFSSAHPLTIDWGTPRKCDHVYGSFYYRGLSAIRIQHSSDGANWTTDHELDLTLSNSQRSQTIEESWEGVSARYWRILPVCGSSYSDTNYAYFNGANAYFGHRAVTNLHFKTEPSEGDIITADVETDIPYKSADFIFVFTHDISLNIG